MASPCEVLVDGGPARHARDIARIAAQEAWRVERKWSRYRDGNIIHRINTAAGRAVRVDDETADMLDYAQTVWRLSGGRFDITSGILRRAWHFDGSDRLPTGAEVCALLALVGWQRAQWARPLLTLEAGMELDFGGIGKEYAVDQALRCVQAMTSSPVLLNFGGDIACGRPRRCGTAWHVGMLDHDGQGCRGGSLQLTSGGLATSGDAYRHLLRDGIRYGHVLNATTGWPVPDAPASVTVVASSCTLAGMLATLALLHGNQAETFLRAQAIGYVVDHHPGAQHAQPAEPAHSSNAD